MTYPRIALLLSSSRPKPKPRSRCESQPCTPSSLSARTRPAPESSGDQKERRALLSSAAASGDGHYASYSLSPLNLFTPLTAGVTLLFPPVSSRDQNNALRVNRLTLKHIALSVPCLNFEMYVSSECMSSITCIVLY